MNNLARLLVVATLLGVRPTAGMAEDARIAIVLRGFVPLSCKAQFDAAFVAAETEYMLLGTLDEACNNAAGYRVYVDRSSELASATLTIDGLRLPLSGTGPFLIAQTRHAGQARRRIALSMPGGARGGTLSFRITPI